MTSRLAVATLLVCAAPAFAGPAADCPGGSCKNRDALYRLADPSSDPGTLYDNSRGSARSPGSVAGGSENANYRPLRRPDSPQVSAAKTVPEPAAAKESTDGGGLMGFLSKNKWNIAGSVVGLVAGFLLGGGLLGGLLGIGIGLGVAFLGPKLFG